MKEKTFDSIFDKRIGIRILDHFSKLIREKPVKEAKEQLNNYDVNVPDVEIYGFTSFIEKKLVYNKTYRFEMFKEKSEEFPKISKVVSNAVANAKIKVIDNVIEKQFNDG